MTGDCEVFCSRGGWGGGEGYGVRKLTRGSERCFTIFPDASAVDRRGGALAFVV